MWLRSIGFVVSPFVRCSPVRTCLAPGSTSRMACRAPYRSSASPPPTTGSTGSTRWTSAAKGAVGTLGVGVRHEFGAHCAEVGLIEWDQVVEALIADGPAEQH